MARTGRAVSRLRTARRLSLRFSGAARACQLARTGRAVPTRPALHKTPYDRTRAPSRFLVASNCRGRRRSPPLLQIQRPRTRAMKLTLTSLTPATGCARPTWPTPPAPPRRHPLGGRGDSRRRFRRALDRHHPQATGAGRTGPAAGAGRLRRRRFRQERWFRDVLVAEDRHLAGLLQRGAGALPWRKRGAGDPGTRGVLCAA